VFLTAVALELIDDGLFAAANEKLFMRTHKKRRARGVVPKPPIATQVDVQQGFPSE
jgi:hypothetical protein